MTPTPIKIAEKFELFREQWMPKGIAQVNECQLKLARLEGDFVWHSHPDTDEAFLVISGILRIDFRDGRAILQEGELLVVPKGVEHKPFAKSECLVMLLSRAGTVNTGDAPATERTADPSAWI